MSYFPSPDPQKLRNAIVQNAPYYTQTPPTPAQSQPSPSKHSIPGSAVEPSINSESPSMNWHSHEPHGLGLMPMPVTGSHLDYNQPSSSAGPVGMSLSWPSEFSNPQPIRHGMMTMRKDSWSEGCDPMSTLLPTAPMWDQTTMSQAEYQSPERSEYSTSTQASCMSSPYAHSDSFLRAAGSPVVKLENAADYIPGQLHYIPESVPFTQSLVVRPGDLVTYPPSMPHQAAASPILGSSHTGIDCKPVLPPMRPDNRRAFSSGDHRSASFDDRPKRGFTKPETANCQCDRCGKLFQRSYNLKAHLETHDPNRSQPHMCDYIDCDKRFVRRTDLLRHEHSVRLSSQHLMSCTSAD